MTPGYAPEHLPTMGTRAWPAEGARVAITTCAICGASLLLDPSHKVDVVELHRLWHRDNAEDFTR